MLFETELAGKDPKVLEDFLSEQIKTIGIPAMIVTLGEKGAVFAGKDGSGYCPAQKVEVVDTTGAGDAFCAGVSCGLSCGRALAKATDIGSAFAASVIGSKENVCPKMNIF